MPRVKHDIKLYDEPEPVREEYTEMVPLHMIRKGDVLAGHRVSEIIRGHKYVTIKGAGGRQLMREPVDTPGKVQVHRDRETQESRDARLRAMKNNDVVNALAGYEADWTAAKANFEKELTEGTWGRMRSEFYGSLMSADARHQVWAGFAHVVEVAQAPNSESPLAGLDHVAVYEAYCDLLKEQVFAPYSNGPLGRSTNTIDNLQDDVLRHARVEFVTRGLSYYW